MQRLPSRFAPIFLVLLLTFVTLGCRSDAPRVSKNAELKKVNAENISRKRNKAIRAATIAVPLIVVSQSNVSVLAQSTIGNIGFGTKSYYAFIDTGASHVFLPSHLGVNIVKTGKSEVATFYEGPPRNLEMVTIPKVQMGSYISKDAAACLIPSNYAPPAPKTLYINVDDINGSAPRIGWSAWGDGVVSLDWERKEMKVYPPEYDLTKDPRQPGDILLTLSSEPDQLPFLEGTIEGVPARFLLDTGQGFEGVVVSPVNPEKYLSNKTPAEKKPRTAYEFLELKKKPLLHWSLNGLTGTQSLQATAPFLVSRTQNKDFIKSLGIDAYIGPWLLQRYRVTIDRQRRKLLLEPFPRAEETKKQPAEKKR